MVRYQESTALAVARPPTPATTATSTRLTTRPTPPSSGRRLDAVVSITRSYPEGSRRSPRVGSCWCAAGTRRPPPGDGVGLGADQAVRLRQHPPGSQQAATALV